MTNKNFRAPASYDCLYGIDLMDKHGKVQENVSTYAEARFKWHGVVREYRKSIEEDKRIREEQDSIESRNNLIRAEWFNSHPHPSAADLAKLKKLLIPMPERSKIRRPYKPMMRYYAPGLAPTPV